MDVGGPVFSILFFLSNRQQRVFVDRKIRQFKPVVSGVSQSSVLNLLLLILYTAIIHVLNDDTTLYGEVASPSQFTNVFNSFNRDLAKVQSWSSTWRMKLNPRTRKTQQLLSVDLGHLILH